MQSSWASHRAPGSPAPWRVSALVEARAGLAAVLRAPAPNLKDVTPLDAELLLRGLTPPAPD